MITRTASVYFSGGRYVFAASTKMPEGFWQICHVSDAIETVETREIGKLTLDALSRSGGAVKGVFANSRASVAGKMLGFKSEKSFVGATRSVMVELDDRRVRVTRMDSDLSRALALRALNAEGDTIARRLRVAIAAQLAIK